MCVFLSPCVSVELLESKGATNVNCLCFFLAERSYLRTLRVTDLKVIIRYLRDTYGFSASLSGLKQEIINRLATLLYSPYSLPTPRP